MSTWTEREAFTCISMGINVAFTIFRLRVERWEPIVKLKKELQRILIRKIK
jgi:hypothetical protein